MKRFVAILLTAQFMLMIQHELYSQSNSDMKEFGISAGTFTNFPCNQDYLKDDMTVFYLAPYVRTGKHEFSAGLVYPLTTSALFFTDNSIYPRLGATAGYKFYIFNVYGRENLFVHYSFQYLQFKGSYDSFYKQFNGSYGTFYNWSDKPYKWNETDIYINNVIGLGYNIFFDVNGRFGFYYILDYVISQTGYQFYIQDYKRDSWVAKYVWNNLSTNLGFIFKITSLKKKEKK